ncbi:MAG: molybdenum cofactor guanylyltransferase [Leptospiraceae bacterium]|nr:molybdenum cofactor guanylyltransferase [Leptospiraceae bacterium]MCK6382329.1 molybdenum cofactor guanylyltransferase [Leptospiraceae bacterium]NUM40887.1 molybdenum cofactor guanylyltransferase [Leptospiraceae bacterium]
MNKYEISKLSTSQNPFGKSIVGVVLCGGLSKRMGTDKGTLKTRGKYWADYSLTILKNFTNTVIFSIREDQFGLYRKIFPNSNLILDNANAKGPLNGILSVYEKFPDCDLLIHACDMISMDKNIVSILYTKFKNFTGFEFYVFKIDGKIEPLCGIYTCHGLKKLKNQIDSVGFQSYSLKEILAKFKTLYIEDENISKNFFKNINYPEDILLE